MNHKQLGTFSFEGTEIESFIGLRPKCYSIKYCDQLETVKNKGINLNHCDLRFANYKKFLFGDKIEEYTTQGNFVSRFHRKFKKVSQKKCFSSLDYKRFWLSQNTSYAFGHFFLKIFKETEILIQEMLDIIAPV